MECHHNSDVLLVGCVPPPIGGVSQHVWRLARKLADSGITTHVLDTHPAPGKYEIAGSLLRTSPKSTLLKTAWLVRQLRSHPNAVVHFHNSAIRSPRVFGWILNACPPQQRKILTLHHGDLQAHFAKLSTRDQASYRKLLRRFDRILTLSPQQTAFYRETAAIPDDKLVRSSSLLHLSSSWIRSICSAPVEPSATAQQEAAHHIVASGYPYADYWHAQTIHMVDRLRESHSASLTLCLYGPQTDHLRELRELANSRPHVRILWGLDFIPFMRLLSQSSLYVRPTVKDSYGLAVTDAASLGRPVVASDVCPRDPRAILFPTGSEQAFFDTVRSALTQEHTRVTRPRPGAAADAYASILQAYQLPPSDFARTSRAA